MKKIFTLLVLGIILSSQVSEAQEYVNYNKKWYLGLNFGGTYHSNTEVDVNHLYRGGAGFTLGKSFNYKQGRLISWDLRVRYLIAAYRGLSNDKFMLDSTNYNVLNLGPDLQNYQQDYGYYQPNFHSWVNDWSLELQLNTNLLREKTGWNLFVFGGIGTTRYNTTIDLYDNLSGLGNIKPENKLNEKGLQISDYETKVVERREWMPSFGAGISKQITPNVSFEIMGRMTWTRHNDFDGMPYNFDGTASKNDRYHYASAGFKFRLGGDGKANGNSHNNGTSNTNTNVNNGGTTTPQKPVVDFTNPSTSTYTTNQSTFYIKANVFYVTGLKNVTFLQDGVMNHSFSFNSNTNEFTSVVQLHDGDNVFEITGTNDYGSDDDKVIIIKKDEEPCIIPTISNISPINNTTVSNNSTNISAHIAGYTSGTSIKLYKESTLLGNMTYNSTNYMASKTINLSEGVNHLKIVVTNDCGLDEKVFNLIYKNDVIPCTKPNISTITPVNNKTVTNSSIQITALITGYTSGTTIKLYKGNNIQGNMSYNNSSQIASKAVNLSEGNNTIRIVVSNTCGSNDKTINIIYRKDEEPCLKPIIGLVTPQNNTTLSNSNTTIQAQINNYKPGTSIKLYKNNAFVGNMVYNPSTGVASKSVNLSEGNNNYNVKVSNTCGFDQSNLTLIYEVNTPCTPPTIGFVSPQTNTTLTNSNVTVQAQINNYTPGTSIKLYKNNAFVGNMIYNPSTGVASKSVILSEGSNNYNIKVANTCGNNQATVSLIYEVNTPCTPPTIGFVSPQTNTTLSNSNVTVEAQINNFVPGTSIKLYKNNVFVGNMIYNANTSVASKTVVLTEGNNNYKIIVSNSCGNNQSTITLIYEVDTPCTPPTIGITSPLNNTTLTTASVNIDAIINNYTLGTTVQLFQNNTLVGNMSYNLATHKVSKSVTLVQGNNSFKVKVTNACGNDEKTFNVIFKGSNPIPCDEPTATPFNPQSTSITQSDANVSLKIKTTHITSNTQIEVTNNNAIIPFSFNVATQTITININNLNYGLNTIKTTVTNNCGNDKLIYNITRERCKLPVIGFNSNGTTTNSTYVLNASISNLNDANLIVLTLNGTTHNFNFNENTGELLSTLTLQPGNNTISIRVNKCKEIIKNLNVIYTSPCNAPTINITTANTSASPTYVFKADITNIDNANNLTVKLNGNVVNSIFTAANGQLKAYLTLVEGQNTIQVIANGCETVTKDFVVTYEAPCVTPVITLTSNTTSTSSSYTFTVSIAGDVSQSDINVVSNGGQTQFGWVDFNKNLHQLTANITLVDGQNTITVTVNGCETVTETFVINYTNNSGHDTPGNEDPNSQTNETETNTGSNENNTETGNEDPNAQTNETETNTGSNTGSNENNTETGNENNDPQQPCGPRFNPGNSDWEFCLTTPTGIYTRDDLANNSNFTYSGPASSVFFKPIAGGGDAVVNGSSYTIQNGKYYLFTGNLTVDVSSSHPGSMGHWEICLTSSSNPTFGNGNNRPTSPCENNGNGNKASNTSQPEIIKVSPSKNTVIVNSSTYLFKAKVNHINSKNDVNIFVNGIRQTNFIYSKTSNQVSLVTRLKKGQNTIRIEATNSNGKDVEDYIITYQISNTGTKTNTGSGTKPKTGTTTKPKTGTSTKPKTGSTGSGTNTKKTNTSGTKSSGTTIKPKTGTTTKPKTGTTTKPKTGSTKTKKTGTTINKGGR